MAEHDHRERIFQWWLHESETVNERTDWFLIFHAILLEAFYSSSRSGVVGLLGITTSFIWLVVGIREVWDLHHLSAAVRSKALMGDETAHVLAEVLRDRQRKQPVLIRWARSTPTFCIVTPMLVFGAWLAVTKVLAAVLGPMWRCLAVAWRDHPAVAAAAACFGVVTLTLALWRTPAISDESVANLAPEGAAPGPGAQQADEADGASRHG